VECPANEAETVKKILEYEMENAVKLTVPLTVDAHVGMSWAEAH
jgi:DNA polymerase-1